MLIATYVVQALNILFALLAAYTGYHSYRQRQMYLVFINGILIAVNVAIFCFQFTVRAAIQ